MFLPFSRLLLFVVWLMSWCSVVLFVCKTVSARPSWHTFPDIHPFWGWVSILLKNSELFYLTHHDITFISFMSPGSVESAPLIFVWSHLCRTIQGGLNERCAIHLFQYLNTTSVKGVYSWKSSHILLADKRVGGAWREASILSSTLVFGGLPFCIGW